MRKSITLIFTLFIMCACTHKESATSNTILPVPAKAELNSGKFTFDNNTVITIAAPENDKNAIKRVLKEAALPFGEEPAREGSNVVTMSLCDSVENVSSPEGYSIGIEEKSITVRATTGAGLFYATQTLLQLADDGCVPTGTIVDEPQFAYRGMMLDVSRHFFGKDFVKKQIDALARFKMNRLHLHLTDAAGWRVEIKKYPRLTAFAAWRKGASWKEWWSGSREYADEGDKEAYGGYYTQEDIKEIVAYAAERYITIIPEIEMPAHSEEVLTAYPELSCTHEPYKQADFCVGNEQTFTFLEDVLTEIMELFPSEYIHIGGDEAAKKSWSSCPLCQKRMSEENLQSVDELQSYLIKRIERFLNSKGRHIIGWDEILDGGLAPNATVMSWRGTQGGVEAARSGHKAIMTPGEYCYLDSYQDAPHTQPMAFGPYMPLEKVYSYNPVEGLGEKEAALIYGIQGNLWAEYIPTEEMMEYMAYPRILAIAEIGWSNPSERNYSEFKKRAIKSVEWLHSNGYNAFDLAGEYGQRREALETSVHLAKDKDVTYATASPYNDKYNAGGNNALTDGIHGGWTYTDKRWQGFIKGGVDVVIDLETEQEIKSVSADFMQMCIPDVWFPAAVTISTSVDGVNFNELQRIEHNVVRDEGLSFKKYAWNGTATARYIRYKAECGTQGGWLFTDEIVIK